ncbi:HBL/NHE enterotoxin family protein [Chengkuizengella sediminis]|uniref:HBL/NHE enterotoxin family protein n=1 Tax=Chengkuizengella sediminis TaxID=1885917 RepID=UPI00138A6C21|nr:HBL/NHE enterotoxin family protein [Chengkuizengella sediminis]NDI33921.1 alpha-helical pore-forming toxin family protein [Chengkuizengella sediminis]
MRTKRILITGLISIMIANIFFIPNDAQASDNLVNVQSNLIQSIQNLQTDLQELGQQQLLINQSALELLTQPELSIENYEELTVFQDSFKDNARLWLDDIKTQNAQFIQNIISFNNVVNSFYEPLVELSQNVNNDPESKNQLIVGLTYILDQVELIQGQTDNNLLDTGNLNSTINREHEEFSVAISLARDDLTNEESRLEELKTELDELKGEREQIVAFIVGSSIGFTGSTLGLIAAIGAITIATGPTTWLIVGLVGSVFALSGSTAILITQSKRLHNINHDIAEISREIAEINLDVSIMNINEISMDQFANRVDDIPIENVNNTLNLIKDELENTIFQIQFSASIDNNFLVNLFTELRDSMNQVSDQAEIIQSFSQLPLLELDLDEELYEQID